VEVDTMKCPNCKRELVMTGRIGAKMPMNPSEAVNMEEGVTDYTCQNNKCKYYNQKLVWNNLKNNWKKLPK
jgi:hypothetical protein